MALKELDREAREHIELLKSEDKQNQEIYEVLKNDYEDKRLLAHMIYDTPHPYYKEQTKVPYYTLLSILIFLLISSFILWVKMAVGVPGDQIAKLFVFLLVPIILAVHVYLVYDYRVVLFKPMAFLPIFFIFVSLYFILFGYGTDIKKQFLNILLHGTIAGLLLYLQGALLPEYDADAITKNADGDYSLPDW